MSQPLHARVISARTVQPEGLALDIGADVVLATRLAIAALSECAPPPREGLAELCWRMMRDDVEYIEETGDQYIRMPWATLRDGVADCKSTATFIASVCAAAGCAVLLRMVTWPGGKHFAHVYAVVDGSPVDPLLDFGSEYRYLVAIDEHIS